MQSFRQYREIGRRVAAHYESKKRPNARRRQSSDTQIAEEKGNGVSNDTAQRHGSSPTLSPSPDDLERGEETKPRQGLEREVEAHNGDEEEGISECNLEDIQRYGTGIGRAMTGINVRRRTTREGGGDNNVFVVGFQGDNDPLNPHQWPLARKIWIIGNIAAIGWIVGFSSAVDSGVLSQAAKAFGVSEVTESLATALFLIAFGCGALVTGPFSEEFGRNPVYIVTMLGFMIFVMASALAPNIGAQLAFRYIAGLFAATPLTAAGGSVSDLFNPIERVYVFPIFAASAFMGPVFGPVVGGFIGESTDVTWRWTEWVTLITVGCILTSLILTLPETYAPILLKYKAQHLRRITGDDRYVARSEIIAGNLPTKIRRALYRPFLILFREPIVLVFALYITIIYIVLFTFLNGYAFIFTETYGISQGLTGLCFLGIILGQLCCLAVVPLIGKWYRQDLARAQRARAISDQNLSSDPDPAAVLPPEHRLWLSMLAAPAVPISLFWMGWTSRPDISIWSPLAASVLCGYGIVAIFISTYQYLIDVYDLYAASALATITVVRYVMSGGMVVVAIPMYGNLGIPKTLSIMGALSGIMTPVPYLLYRYGRKIRGWSKYARRED